MTADKLLLVVESAAMHFGDGTARATLRMLAFELRNEIKREQANAGCNNTLSNGEITQTSTRTEGT